MQSLLIALLVAAGLYGAVVAAYYAAQRTLLFPAPHDYVPPAAVGLPDVREAPLRTQDGETVMTWRTGRTAGRPVVLAFHGNAESLPRLAPHAAFWQARGYDIVLATYRGYPGSTGRPSEKALVADALAVFDAIVADGTAPEDIIVAGFSLGTAMAVAVGAERSPRALFLQAPPSAVVEVASYHYPWLPVGLLMRDPFRSIERIGRVEAPVFIVHGDSDPVVPLRFGRRLFEAAGDPKRLVVLPGAGHDLGPDDGWAEFENFLGAVAAREEAAR